MLRGILAVLAGFATMSVIVMAGTLATMAALVPGGLTAMKGMRDNPPVMPSPTPRYYVVNIALSLAAAVVGGWVTMRIGGPPAMGLLFALGVLILAMGVGSAFAPGSGAQPRWYRVLIPLVGVAGVALSATMARG